MTTVISFEEALKFSQEARRKHLLLGNGFSISKFSKIFSYSSLLSEADFSGKDHLRRLFEELGSEDFELAIKTLQNSAAILKLYGSASDPLHDKLIEDASNLKEILIRTIARTHPEDPNELLEDEFAACGLFLKNFLASSAPQLAGMFIL